ncbi:hypothetical protein EGT74_25820 [Chitinophaga lutea]|uniref:Uncharacterized protein n=1 Tax=Chitinophaga lutea TaxID=2488634 RepID=A0A3N4PCJ5_9BACT|nr:hypothetical protein EGT74_25820 [Chitinophaga lutea]
MVAVVAVCIALFYYVLTYRFKESLRYAVKMQTKGRYAFDAGSAEVSFRKMAITLRKSSVRCLDPRDDAAAYDIHIPEMYFSLASWTDVLVNKKVIADSIAFIAPHVKMNVRRRAARRKEFKGTDILDILEKTLMHFNARSFTMKGAVCEYLPDNAPALRVNDINLYVQNFREVNNDDSRFFGSDRVVFFLGRQHWVLPKRRQEVRFSSLRFDSKGQRLEIDSVDYQEQDTSGKGGLQLQADRLFFNSRHLPALYQHNRLLIDTLTCVRPVLTVPHGRHGAPKDTAMAASRMPFRYVQIGFINVVDADVHLTGRQAASRNSNLRIYNLRVTPGAQDPLQLDSIRMDLKQLVFYSRDSLYQMRIDEFTVERDGILFSGVHYSPTDKNRAAKTVTATAPALRLKNVNFESLLRKHLHADEAELVSPVITVHQQHARAPKKAPVAGDQKKMDIFYQTLHGISEMVHVEHFRLRNGELGFKAGGEQGAALQVHDINAHVLLNRLFHSDSLVDVKHAIPDLRVGHMELQSKGARISARNYRFDGVTRRNWGESIDAHLPNGSHIAIKDIFWEVFDWDVLQQTGDIQVAQLRAGSIVANIRQGAAKKPARPLPVIRIANVQANQFSLTQASEQGSTRINGKALVLQQLQSASDHFAWSNASVQLSELAVKRPAWLLTAGAGTLHSNRENVLHGIRFEKDDVKVHLPLLRFKLPLHSSAISSLNIPYLYADSATVDVIARKRTDGAAMAGMGNKGLQPANTTYGQTVGAPKPQPAGGEPVNPQSTRTSVAVTSARTMQPTDLDVENGRQPKTAAAHPTPDIHAGDIQINHTHISYTGIKEKDSVHLNTTLQLRIKDAHSAAHRITFHSAAASLSDTRLQQTGVQLQLPFARLELREGAMQQGAFSAHAVLDWRDGVFHFSKGGAQVSAEALSGSVPRMLMTFREGEAINWQQVAAHLAASGRKLHYGNDKLNAGAGSFEWTGNALRLKDMFMLPVLDREATFQKEKWQGNYMTLNGGTVTLFPTAISDSMVHIGRVELDSADLHVSRDKLLPFQHGVEKFMPTTLVRNIRFPFRVDTIQIAGSKVTYAERTPKSKGWSEIPLTNLSGTILRLGNRFDGNDSLYVNASANVFSGNVRHLTYVESYGDSLAGFAASLGVAPASLPELAGSAMPHGNVKVVSGQIDTVYSTWEGNTYAAFGQMHFYYSNLRVKIGSRRHPGKWRLVPALETWLVNLLIPSRVTKPSLIFYPRDQERFIFNYWINVQKRGVMTAVGLKRNRAYRKQYRKYQQQYRLPATATGF